MAIAVDNRVAGGAQAAPRRRLEPKASRIVEGLVVAEIVCQLALLSTALAPYRLIFRVAVFGLSLGFLILLSGRGRSHPAAKFGIGVIAVLGLSLLNPDLNSVESGVAQLAMYLAILSPLFWMPRLRMDLPAMKRVLMLMWGFQSISAAIGVLQVYFPGRFRFAISSVVQSNGSSYLAGLQFQNAFGQMVYRPMGLTDTPGGAAGAGFLATLLGALFFLTDHRRWMRPAYVATMLTGMAAIYLSQVRVMLIMAVTCLLSFVSVLAWRALTVREVSGKQAKGSRRLAMLAGCATAIVIVGFIWAVSIGGASVGGRFNSLVASDPTVVYQKNRGMFLTYTLDYVLPEYPLGAGPGRWGMMAYYFGNPLDSAHPALWSEIQWTGWLYDGGIPLVMFYVMALGAAFWTAYKIALNRFSGELAIFGALVLAYNVSALAATFDSDYFIGGAGLDFWMLNAMLFAVAWQSGRRAQPPRAGR